MKDQNGYYTWSEQGDDEGPGAPKEVASEQRTLR